MMEKFMYGRDVALARQNFGGKILDFSENINPLGLPEGVAGAVKEALRECVHYPDPLCKRLRGVLSDWEGIPIQHILCGNGVVDLIFRLVLALRPRKALLPSPTLTEYSEALEMVGCQVAYHPLREEDGFRLTEEFLMAMTPDVDLILLCNPNNPTGEVIAPALMSRILDFCYQKKIFLVVDESSLEFLDNPDEYSLLSQVEDHPNLLVLRSFAQYYAMAGLRLGYCLCSSEILLGKMQRCGHPWNVSVPAQEAGIAALGERGYRERTRVLIPAERAFLRMGLEGLGYRVYGSRANFLFFQAARRDLCSQLEQEGVFLSSCAHFPRLDDRYYRAAVRTHGDNDSLLGALRRIERGL